MYQPIRVHDHQRVAFEGDLGDGGANVARGADGERLGVQAFDAIVLGDEDRHRVVAGDDQRPVAAGMGPSRRPRVLSHARKATVSSRPRSRRGPTTIRLTDRAGFGLVQLQSASGLRAQFLPNGALFALLHGETLINQMLPGPAERGLDRLLVRPLCRQIHEFCFSRA